MWLLTSEFHFSDFAFGVKVLVMLRKAPLLCVSVAIEEMLISGVGEALMYMLECASRDTMDPLISVCWPGERLKVALPRLTSSGSIPPAGARDDVLESDCVNATDSAVGRPLTKTLEL